MRVRKKATPVELRWKRLQEARLASLARRYRSADDESFQCGACGAQIEVTAALASDPLAVFCCPHCREWSVRAE